MGTYPEVGACPGHYGITSIIMHLLDLSFVTMFLYTNDIAVDSIGNDSYAVLYIFISNNCLVTCTNKHLDQYGRQIFINCNKI